MNENFPIIHKSFVVTSTYLIKDRSIRYEKKNFITEHYELFKQVFVDIYKKGTKWFHHPKAQELEIKIRIKFGYSPRTYVYDILWHFYWIFQEYEKEKSI